MKYYPIFLNINLKDCLVVGGGQVGARKAGTLEKCGANVKVISEQFSSWFEKLHKGKICLVKKKYEKKDLKGVFLVLAATNNAELNRQIKKDAASLNMLCNVADSPDDSDFLLPSTMDRGDLILAVSTSGSSPAMARKIRQDLENQFGPEYIKLLQLLGNIRKILLSSGQDPEGHKKVFQTLIEKGILELIQADDAITINLILEDIFKKKYLYEDLVSIRSDE